MEANNLKFTILRDCQLGALRHDFKKAILYFDLVDEECHAISLPCLNGTRETNFIIEEYGYIKNWSEVGNSWYGNTMDFVICDDKVLALVSPTTHKICLTETPIVYKSGGFLEHFCIESSEEYLEEKYDVTEEDFLALINKEYSKDKDTLKVKKIGQK